MKHPFDISRAWSLSELKTQVLQVLCRLDAGEYTPEQAVKELIEVVQSIHEMELHPVPTKIKTFKLLTLRQVRENQQITLEEASKRSGVPESTLQDWEKDCSEAELIGIKQLLQLYCISMNHVHFGPEETA